MALSHWSYFLIVSIPTQHTHTIASVAVVSSYFHNENHLISRFTFFRYLNLNSTCNGTAHRGLKNERTKALFGHIVSKQIITSIIEFIAIWWPPRRFVRGFVLKLAILGRKWNCLVFFSLLLVCARYCRVQVQWWVLHRVWPLGFKLLVASIL